MNSADPALVEGWLRARSLARGLPQPVPDSGGWRVETNLPAELCRYVFASPCEDLRTIAHEITAPRIVLKLCANEAAMRGLVPPRWQIAPGTWIMTCDHWTNQSRAPFAYRTDITVEGPVIAARILATDGTIVASGYAAAWDGVFVYDRIITAE